jgi:ferredoxin
MVPAARPREGKKKEPRIDLERCLGCGVCAIKCESRALSLVPRGRRVLTPETTFERVILQCLERGTLQNQIFDDPGSKSQAWLRGFLGGVLRLPPVKKALLGDALRSRFLASMKAGVSRKGKEWVTRV